VLYLAAGAGVPKQGYRFGKGGLNDREQSLTVRTVRIRALSPVLFCLGFSPRVYYVYGVQTSIGGSDE